MPARVGRGGGAPFVIVMLLVVAPAEYRFGLGEFAADFEYPIDGPPPPPGLDELPFIAAYCWAGDTGRPESRRDGPGG